MTWWYETKLFLEQVTGFSMDALHVLAGVVLHLAAAALLRKPVSQWAPWLVVLIIELLNEINDLFVERWPDPDVQYGEALSDLILTMALPTLLLVATRSRPSLFVRRHHNR